MLNRRHIRVKAMQVLYMHHQTGKEHNIPHLQRSFDSNVQRMYQLYLYYLAFLHELWHLSGNQELRKKQQPPTPTFKPQFAQKLHENTILQALFNQPGFEKELQQHQVIWNHEADDQLIKRVYNDLKASERYKDFVQLFDEPSQHSDLLMHIVKHYTEHDAQFEQHLEEEFPNLHDDIKLVFSMLKKTFSNVAKEEESFFVTLVQDEENTIEFGHKLIDMVVRKEPEITPLLNAKVTKWEPGQIAITDRIILQMGLAEFLFFPSIPDTVTINEYVEIAKQYSPPQSRKFVNGLLDAVSKEMHPE